MWFVSDMFVAWYKVRLCQLLHIFDLSEYQLNAQFFYSSTINMLHYTPQHVSSSTLLIIRRTNCITTASGIVLCKQSYSMRVESGIFIFGGIVMAVRMVCYTHTQLHIY